MRVLVTGACGFVGGYLIEHLRECGDEVLAGVIDSVQKKLPCETVKFDVTDMEACGRIINMFKPELIYHLAGIAFVPEAENNFDRALKVNVGGTNNIFRTCHLLQLKTTVLLVSSAEIYGRITPQDLPIRESTALRPANNYSLSKGMAEMVAHRYDQFGYVRSVIVRPFNHIGPGQNNRFVASSFAYQLAQIAKGHAPARMEVGNLQAKRDFTDVRDMVKAYRLAALKGSGVYNLGSGRSVSIQEMLDTLVRISGLKVQIDHDPARMRGSEVPDIYCSYEKAQKELDWRPTVPLQDTLSSIYQYWLKN